MRSLLLSATLMWAAPSAALAQAADRGAEDIVVLADAIRTEALPVIASSNYLGLGAEAARINAWLRDHKPPVTLRVADSSLEDGARQRTKLSSPMTRTLRRVNRWYGLAATPANPITHAQLEAATLAPASVARIQGIFDAAIGRGVRIGELWLTPETGGEAALDSELRLVESIDPRWATVVDLARVAANPDKVAALRESRPDEVDRVDAHGLLKVALARLRLGSPGSREEVRRAVTTIAQNSAPTYTLEPEQQFALIAGADWQGRYVGGWHTHSPHFAKGHWVGGDVPSFEDMQNAIQAGQYLTVSFQPAGFDLYDAAELAEAGRVDLSLLKVIRYRSPAWRDHFQKLLPRETRTP